MVNMPKHLFVIYTFKMMYKMSTFGQLINIILKVNHISSKGHSEGITVKLSHFYWKTLTLCILSCHLNYPTFYCTS